MTEYSFEFVVGAMSMIVHILMGYLLIDLLRVNIGIAATGKLGE